MIVKRVRDPRGSSYDEPHDQAHHYNKADRACRVEIPGPDAITIGAAYTGKTATAIRTGTTAHIFIDHTLVRKLTINLNRRSQPLYQRPGRPT